MAPTLLTIGLSPRGELSNKLEGKSPANGSGEPEVSFCYHSCDHRENGRTLISRQSCYVGE